MLNLTNYMTDKEADLIEILDIQMTIIRMCAEYT